MNDKLLNKDDILKIENTVSSFGTEVDVIQKRGSFHKFEIKSWIKSNDNKFYTSLTIGELKKLFKLYSSFKRIKINKKKGREVKAIEWVCDVLKKGEIKLDEIKFNVIKECNRRHNLFVHKDILYYFVFPFLYKNSKTDEYVYLDSDEGIILGTGLYTKHANREKLDKWILNYQTTKEKKK